MNTEPINPSGSLYATVHLASERGWVSAGIEYPPDTRWIKAPGPEGRTATADIPPASERWPHKAHYWWAALHPIQHGGDDDADMSFWAQATTVSGYRLPCGLCLPHSTHRLGSESNTQPATLLTKVTVGIADALASMAEDDTLSVLENTPHLLRHLSPEAAARAATRCPRLAAHLTTEALALLPEGLTEAWHAL